MTNEISRTEIWAKVDAEIKVGSAVRAYDFAPLDDDLGWYVEGVVTEDCNGKLTIAVTKDTLFPAGERIEVSTYKHALTDNEELYPGGRIQLIEGA